MYSTKDSTMDAFLSMGIDPSMVTRKQVSPMTEEEREHARRARTNTFTDKISSLSPQLSPTEIMAHLANAFPMPNIPAAAITDREDKPHPIPIIKAYPEMKTETERLQFLQLTSPAVTQTRKLSAQHRISPHSSEPASPKRAIVPESVLNQFDLSQPATFDQLKASFRRSGAPTDENKRETLEKLINTKARRNPQKTKMTMRQKHAVSNFGVRPTTAPCPPPVFFASQKLRKREKQGAKGEDNINSNQITNNYFSNTVSSSHALSEVIKSLRPSASQSTINTLKAKRFSQLLSVNESTLEKKLEELRAKRMLDKLKATSKSRSTTSLGQTLLDDKARLRTMPQNLRYQMNYNMLVDSISNKLDLAKAEKQDDEKSPYQTERRPRMNTLNKMLSPLVPQFSPEYYQQQYLQSQNLKEERDRQGSPPPRRGAGSPTNEIFTQTALISHVSRSERESSWIESYGLDAHLYKSVAMYNLTVVSEMKTLIGGGGGFDKSIMASLLGHLITEFEGHHSNSSAIMQTAITQVLKSVFVLGASNSATNLACSEIFNRNSLRQKNSCNKSSNNIWTHSEPGGKRGGGSGTGKHQAKSDPIKRLETFSDEFIDTDTNEKKRFLTFLQCPTWLEACRYWKARCAKEEELLPYMEKLKLKMSREREIEDRVLNRTCTIWTRPMMKLIIGQWAESGGMDKKLAILGSALFRLTEVKPSFIFAIWKKFTYLSKKAKQSDILGELLAKIENLKKELKETQMRCMKKNAELSKLKKVIASINEKLQAALTLLNMPARQPPTLAKIVAGFTTAINAFKKLQEPFIDECLATSFETGAWTTKLSPIMKWTHDLGENVSGRKVDSGVNEQLLPHPEFDKKNDHDDFDYSDEKTIDKWAPGKCKGSVEETPAFEPFGKKSGRVLVRWISMLLKNRWTKNSKIIDTQILKMLSNGCNLRGRDMIEVMKEVVLEVASRNPKMTEKDIVGRFEDYGDIDDNSSVESLEDDQYIQFHDMNPHVNDARALLEIITAVVEEKQKLASRFRYLDQKDFTLEVEPESKKKRRIREAHLKQAMAREADSGIIVNVFSKYCGRRIPIVDSFVQRRFAFFADLFISQFEHHQQIPTYSRWATSLRKLDLEANNYLPMCDLMNEISTNKPTFYKHEELLDFAKKLELHAIAVKENIDVLHKIWANTLTGRREYREFTPNLTRLSWQSLCTTVLSRKVNEEADIDDGTFTKVCPIRVAQEFKRLGILSDLAITEDIADCRSVLKTRIRDLKRIFQFYAAAEQGGDANTMDAVEYKKLIRDTQLQKDRKVLPSVRVDLIYQACCIDHTAVGKARIDNGTEDIDANKFVEANFRLGSYKYENWEKKRKKKLSAEEEKRAADLGLEAKGVDGVLSNRLLKILLDDVLPNACSVDVDVFRERMESDELKAVFAKHKQNMGVIFRVYAADDVSDDAAVATGDTMNVGELVSFGRAFELVGGPPKLSERAMKVLFAYVQQEDPDGEDENGEALIDDNSEMVISEFLEALTAIGMQLYPDPYNVMEMKVEMFFRKGIVPKAFKMVRFTKLGPPPKGLKALPKEG